MKNRILFIINPISGTHHADDIEKIAREVIDEEQFDVEFRQTEHKRHGIELAKQAVQEGFDIVAAVGGDGTINQVASQLVGTDTAMAVVPHGSGNGLAYHLHIPIHLKKSIQIINALHFESVDVCQLNDSCFFSIAGIGFDAKVAYDFNRDVHRGFFNYFKHILKNYFEYPSGEYTIEYDGKLLRDKAFFITFANSSQWGYNVKIAPMASVQDGRLDICIVKKPKVLFKMLAMDLPKLLSSHFDQSDIVQYLRCEKVRILPADSTKMYLHIDGDSAGLTDCVEIKVLPRALKMIVPAQI